MSQPERCQWSGTWPPAGLDRAAQTDRCPVCGMTYRRFRDHTIPDYRAALHMVWIDSERWAAEGCYNRPADRRAALGIMRQYKLTAWEGHLRTCDEMGEEAARLGMDVSELADYYTSAGSPPLMSQDEIDDLTGAQGPYPWTEEDAAARYFVDVADLQAAAQLEGFYRGMSPSAFESLVDEAETDYFDHQEQRYTGAAAPF